MIDIPKRVTALQNEIKAQKHDIEQLSAKLAASQTAALLDNAIAVDGLRIVTKATEGMALDLCRTMCDELKAANDDVVCVISANADGKINFPAACGKAAVAKGAHAGNILKQVSAITGGKGGGRPDSATSGGRDADKIGEALAAVADIVKSMLK